MFKLVLLLAVGAQLTHGAPMLVDHSQAMLASDTLEMLARAVKRLQDFEIEMLASVPVSHHLNTIFDYMTIIQDIDPASIGKLRAAVFSEMATIQASVTRHAEQLGDFTTLLREAADTLEYDEVETFEVADFIEVLDEMYNRLTEKMFDILMSVEHHIANTERQIRHLIEDIDEDDEPEVSKIREAMDNLDAQYKEGHKELIITLTSVQTFSELLMEQLRALLGKNMPGKEALALWQRNHKLNI